MRSLKETSFYRDALHVLSYDFGDFYLYDQFIIAEFNDGEVVSWEGMGKILVEDIRDIYGSQSKELIYISNRVNNYSVIPSDWIKFKRNNGTIKGYGIISYSNRSYLNALLEKLFINTKLRFFDSLESAISWACQIQRCSTHIVRNGL